MFSGKTCAYSRSRRTCRTQSWRPSRFPLLGCRSRSEKRIRSASRSSLKSGKMKTTDHNFRLIYKKKIYPAWQEGLPLLLLRGWVAGFWPWRLWTLKTRPGEIHHHLYCWLGRVRRKIAFGLRVGRRVAKRREENICFGFRRPGCWRRRRNLAAGADSDKTRPRDYKEKSIHQFMFLNFERKKVMIRWFKFLGKLCVTLNVQGKLIQLP